jgi:hypothetical protein
MATAITPITQQFSKPYLTLDEFKNAPTAIDIDNLVFNSTDPDVQDSELTNVITRASSWIDTYCNQILSATTETEQQRTRVRPDGTLRWHPNNAPIIAVTAISYGVDPNNLAVCQDPSVCWLEAQQVIFPYSTIGLSYSSQGPLGLGFPSTPQQEVFLRYTYVNGYVNTVIVSATAAASSLTVINATGITAGQQLKIYDGMNSENVTVASTYTFGSLTVPLVSPLVYSHSANVSISALPAAIKEAAILVTTAMLKVRGDNAMVMAVTSAPSVIAPEAQHIGSDMDLAMNLLKPYRRIR